MRSLLDLIKNMNKRQRIIAISAVVLVTAFIIVIVAAFTSDNKKASETVSSKASATGKVQNKIINQVTNKVEPAVELQTAEETSEEQLEAEKVGDEQVRTGSNPYYIRVNYGANTVTIYGKDDDGNYTVPLKAMICSCGISTPKSGVYKTSNGYRWGTLIGGVYGQYSTRIVGNILFHSVPYTEQSPDSLEYWEFDKLGTKASAGCVRLQVKDAQWIYYYCDAGTMVEFYSSDDPGPLGKPSAPKISDSEFRDWDPTDDAEGNPWRSGYQEEEPAPEQPTTPEPSNTPEPEKPASTNTNNGSSNQNKMENTTTKPENTVTNTTTNTTPAQKPQDEPGENPSDNPGEQPGDEPGEEPTNQTGDDTGEPGSETEEPSGQEEPETNGDNPSNGD